MYIKCLIVLHYENEYEYEYEYEYSFLLYSKCKKYFEHKKNILPQRNY